MNIINNQLTLDNALDFINKQPIAQYAKIDNFYKIAGDASFRSYYRININDKSYVIMFAPPKLERTSHFIEVDKFLIKNKMPAPKIIGSDTINGLLLLEDFGDNNINNHLKNITNNKNDNLYQEQEQYLYCKAIDILLEIANLDHYHFVSSYNNNELLREAMLLIEWYLPFKKIKISDEEIAKYKKTLFNLFDLLDKSKQILVLRDYHSENLMVINQKDIGILDFQDALIGSPAYDLVSLLEDARRDILPQTVDYCFKYYLNNIKSSFDYLINDYHILSLQRNLKILGIFCRLSIRDEKDQYLKYLPRVESFVTKRINDNYCQFTNKELSFMLPISDLLKKILNRHEH